ncbi:hypothetical protein KO361_01370 [Candidatus Woesearchaeota archaeon]|nr:hypothetical protein [Candidatus Woesearchaeota archaeon]
MNLEQKIKQQEIKKEPTNQIRKITNYDILLLKYSRTVDNIDMFLGPISEIAKISDSETIKTTGLAIALIKGIIKLPFVTMYLKRTKDYASLYDWIPKEIFSYVVPMGSFIDILRSYEKITFKHYGIKPFTEIPTKKELNTKLITQKNYV